MLRLYPHTLRGSVVSGMQYSKLCLKLDLFSFNYASVNPSLFYALVWKASAGPMCLVHTCWATATSCPALLWITLYQGVSSKDIFVETKPQPSLIHNFCSSPSQAQLENPTYFQTHTKHCFDIPVQFNPEPSHARILSLSSNRGEPAQQHEARSISAQLATLGHGDTKQCGTNIRIFEYIQIYLDEYIHLSKYS